MKTYFVGMRHPVRNRFLGTFFILMIIIGYFILVPPVQSYCTARKRKRSIAYLGSWFFRRLMRLFGITPIVTGLENLPSNSAFVLLSNHQSFLDIGILMHEIAPLAFLAKKELFRIPLFGNSLKAMGCIPVHRGNHRANILLPKTLSQRIQAGYNYCVFPEGTRSPDGNLLPFKGGIFKIIHSSPVPVLPVTILGSGKTMPKKGLALFPQHPRVIVHPVISPEQIAEWTPEEFRNNVRSVIESAMPGT
ncbi:MAG TPA: lysophospholipid acyltransferase family protein [Fibrobacteraceae bacterium]|nr:lysophospholipid acyltransferase family protein [Fibrobacteraceae bacterium]